MSAHLVLQTTYRDNINAIFSLVGIPAYTYCLPNIFELFGYLWKNDYYSGSTS